MICLIDANIIIEPYNAKYYHIDYCPGYWDFLFQHANIFTIKKIQDEIKSDEKLKKLATQIKCKKFDADEEWFQINLYLQKKYDKIEKINEFLGSDARLIAMGMKHEYTVITQEVSVRAESQKIKIPNIADHFGVHSMNIWSLLKKFNIEFIQK